MDNPLVRIYLYTSMIISLTVVIYGQSESMCRSMEYRTLSFRSQNEHQCMIMEKLKDDFERDKISRDQIFSEIMDKLTSIEKKLNTKKNSAVADEANRHLKQTPALTDVPLVRDCHELIRNGVPVSGVYPIQLPLGKIINVWCDMDTDNGGWTVIQRRAGGFVNFTRHWNEYTFGFGNTNSEYWMGLENMYQMAAHTNYSLRIDLWDWKHNHAYAEYKNFFLASEADAFRLHVSGYNGTAGDSLAYHNDMQFSTIDKDNDRWRFSCAQKDEAGWWYNNCGYSILNGIYLHNFKINITADGLIKGIIWFHWKKDFFYSMKEVEMKIKPTLALKLERELYPFIPEQTTQEVQNQTDTTTDSNNNENNTTETVEVENVEETTQEGQVGRREK